MSEFADKTAFNLAIEKIFDDFGEFQKHTLSIVTGIPTVLEHVTRTHFIDPFLRHLGWDISSFTADTITEAQIRGETTLFLDYLGLNQQSRTPILIVEAKAWAIPMISVSANKRRQERDTRVTEKRTPVSLICEGIAHCKTGAAADESPVTADWTGYLSKLLQYVSEVKAKTGYVVKKVAIFSGQWLVIFKDPEAIFLASGIPDANLISVYVGQEELLKYSDEILKQLARGSIDDSFPERIRPSLLPAYIAASNIRRTYRALWISQHIIGPSYRPKPYLNFEVVVVIERSDGALLTVVDEAIQGSELPHQDDQLDSHIEIIEKQSNALVKNISLELKTEIKPASVEEFGGFYQRKNNVESSFGLMPKDPHITLIKQMRREFLLITGEAEHFLLRTPTVNPCQYHDWLACKTQSCSQGGTPILAPSTDPKSFSVSGNSHHCANILVHDRRNSRCQIDAFDEFLCCRSCVFQTFCWKSEELLQLPCG